MIVTTARRWYHMLQSIKFQDSTLYRERQAVFGKGERAKSRSVATSEVQMTVDSKTRFIGAKS